MLHYVQHDSWIGDSRFWTGSPALGLSERLYKASAETYKLVCSDYAGRSQRCMYMNDKDLPLTDNN